VNASTYTPAFSYGTRVVCVATVDYGKTGRSTIIRILPNPSGREDKQWYDIRFEDGSLARVPSRDLVQDKAA
jgi:hypothetical protein